MGLELGQDIGRREGPLADAIVNDHDLGIGDFVVPRRAVAAGPVNVGLGRVALVEAALVAGDLFCCGGRGLPTGSAAGRGLSDVAADLTGDAATGALAWAGQENGHG